MTFSFSKWPDNYMEAAWNSTRGYKVVAVAGKGNWQISSEYKTACKMSKKTVQMQEIIYH